MITNICGFWVTISARWWRVKELQFSLGIEQYSLLQQFATSMVYRIKMSVNGCNGLLLNKWWWRQTRQKGAETKADTTGPRTTLFTIISNWFNAAFLSATFRKAKSGSSTVSGQSCNKIFPSGEFTTGKSCSSSSPSSVASSSDRLLFFWLINTFAISIWTALVFRRVGQLWAAEKLVANRTDVDLNRLNRILMVELKLLQLFVENGSLLLEQ